MFNTSEHPQGKTTLNASSTTRKFSLGVIALSAALSLTACGGNDHEETKAVDKVDEAAEMARQNAPEPEPLDLETTETATSTPDEAVAEANAEEGAEVVAEDATTETEEAAAGGELSASAGKDLYESTCKQCHESGLLNAPKFGDSEAWAPRIAQGKETLYKHSAEGFNQMPPQATGDVSEDQVHAAVDYMVDQAS